MSRTLTFPGSCRLLIIVFRSMPRRKHFRFFDLPAEIRNQIYEIIMMNGWTPSTQDCASATRGWTERPSHMGRIAIQFNRYPRLSTVSPRIIALLGTSRRLRFECLPILYRLNQIHLPWNCPEPYLFMSRHILGTIAWTNIREISSGQLWGEVVSYKWFKSACAVLSRVPRLRRVELEMTAEFLDRMANREHRTSSHDADRRTLCNGETLSSNNRKGVISKRYSDVFQYFAIGRTLRVEVVWYLGVDQLEPANVLDKPHTCSSMSCAILETMRRCKETNILRTLPRDPREPHLPSLESFVLRARVHRDQPDVLDEEDESLGLPNDMFKVLLPRFRRNKS